MHSVHIFEHISASVTVLGTGDSAENTIGDNHPWLPECTFKREKLRTNMINP